MDDSREQYIGKGTARICGISRGSCDTYTSTQTIGITLNQGRPECLLGIAAVILGELG
jgi:BRCT domain type II-containing protein